MATHADDEGNATALVALEEQSIYFRGDELIAGLVVIDDEVKVYIALRSLCKHLGLSWSGQFERIGRDPVLKEEVKLVRFPSMKAFGNLEIVCLPLEFLNGWLFGIAPNRVKPALAPKLIEYRRDCFRALWQAFQPDLVFFRRVPLFEQMAVGCSNEHPLRIKGFLPIHQQLSKLIHRQCLRSERMGLPATLTREQWIDTLDAFGWYCAYCQEKPGVLIEHFIPLSQGGGTTQENCVPSCFACNSKKGKKHPSEVTAIPSETLLSIQTYLFALQRQEDGSDRVL